MDQSSLQPHYLSELRQSGIFTESDLLELEDHFFTIYEAEVDNGKPAALALQRAEQALGNREDIIAAFAKKRRWVWAKDLGSFFVFGLVVNLLGLWCLGIGVGNLFSILIQHTALAPAAPWLAPVLMGSFVVLLTILQWKMVLSFHIWCEKLPRVLAKIKIRQVLLPILSALALACLTDPFVSFDILLPEGRPAVWDTDWHHINWLIWVSYLPLNAGIMTTYFGWKAHQQLQKRRSVAARWSLRMMIFFLAACLSPMVNFVLLLLLRNNIITDHYHLAKWIRTLNSGLLVTQLALMFLFPLAYRHIWKRKQYLA